MVTVIIPALNEAATIGQVVDFAWQCDLVSEVLVVDDGSIDGTPDLARSAGARVITSSLLGKGASMADGARAAQNEILVYLDGDLRQLRADVIEAMTAPLRQGEADFVKARFSRAAGRVTTLTARPLLRTFFPELAHLAQPLGGIIAAQASLLRQLQFENDYGVDIGLLLDAVASGARLAEVDIGHIDHVSQPLEALGDMAAQVVRTVLDRAARQGRLRLGHIRDVAEVERRRAAELPRVLPPFGAAQKLALFDMDGTLLQGRFITALARRTQRTVALAKYLDNPRLDPDERTQLIAAVFRGVSARTFEATARAMPLMPGAVETIIHLRKLGYRVGIVSDSYRLATETIRRRVFADFSIAHLMRFQQGRATGEVLSSAAMSHPYGCPLHQHCKANLLCHLADSRGIDPANVVAVGDGENDICLLRAAGQSFAFRPKSTLVQAAAQFHVPGSLMDILPLLHSESCRIPA